jgi:hypothetical protein
MRVRKNVKNLTTAEKTAFVNAVLTLKAKPSMLHPGQQGRYDDYVEIHMNAMMAQIGNLGDPNFVPGWAHDGPAFFPWHRELLLQLENDLQAVSNDPTVTIPYWDWPDPASWPFTDDFLGGDGVGPNMQVQTGPFAFSAPANWTLIQKDNLDDSNFLQRQLGADDSAQNPPTDADVSVAMGLTPYSSAPWKDYSTRFRAQVQYGVHNSVHRYVGGTMLNMTSPNDPVFWLNHCNVDRLWGDWQRQHPAETAYLPTAGATYGHNLGDNMIFSAAPPPPWAGSSTPGSVIDHHALGYRYDSDPIEGIAEAMVGVMAPKVVSSRAMTNFPLLHEMVQQRIKPNRFVLTTFRLAITYDLAGFDGKPHLNYQVGQGPPSISFTGDEIRSQKSEIGVQVTVTLVEAIPDGNSITLTLLLPVINLVGTTEQAFETLAIVTTQRSSIGGQDLVDGVVQSYEVLMLKGKAQFVFP